MTLTPRRITRTEFGVSLFVLAILLVFVVGIASAIAASTWRGGEQSAAGRETTSLVMFIFYSVTWVTIAGVMMWLWAGRLRDTGTSGRWALAIWPATLVVDRIVLAWLPPPTALQSHAFILLVPNWAIDPGEVFGGMALRNTGVLLDLLVVMVLLFWPPGRSAERFGLDPRNVLTQSG